MHAVTIGQSAISQGVGGIFCDGLLKAFDALVKAFLGSLVPPVAALEIASVGFRAGGVGSREAFFLLTGQTQPQRFGNFLGDLFLERENVRRLSAVLLAPDVAAVGGLDQLGTDRQIAAKL